MLCSYVSMGDNVVLISVEVFVNDSNGLIRSDSANIVHWIIVMIDSLVRNGTDSCFEIENMYIAIY